MIRLLQRQGFIEHKPTSASEAAHQQRLLPVGYQFKLVSLQALHDGSLYCVLHHDAIGHVYPGPEVTGFSGLKEDKVYIRGKVSKRLREVLDVMAESASTPSKPYSATQTAGSVVIHRADRRGNMAAASSNMGSESSLDERFERAADGGQQGLGV